MLAAIAESDGQEEVAGNALPRPLQVLVTRDGVPQPDVPIVWNVDNGSLASTGSFTNSLGIASMRWTLGEGEGPVSATAKLFQDPGISVVFQANRWPIVTAFLISASGVIEGEVGTTLPAAYTIRVVKAGGVPAPGIPVQWRPLNGSVLANGAVTDASGLATASWTLGPIAGRQAVQIHVRGRRGGALFIEADANAGPVANIRPVGSIPPRPANFRYQVNDRVEVEARDRFENPVGGAQLVWVALDGPVMVQPEPTSVTTFEGRTSAIVRPTGTPGLGRVLIRPLDGSDAAAVIALTYTDPVYAVMHTGWGFLSPVNGSFPAVDTIPVGTTLRWIQSPFDYDSHGVESVGPLLFNGGGEFPYANPSEVTATFNTPGTYHYRDPHYPELVGTVVVQ